MRSREVCFARSTSPAAVSPQRARSTSPAAVSPQRARSATLNTSSSNMQDIRMKQNINLWLLMTPSVTHCYDTAQLLYVFWFHINYLIRFITLKTFSRNKTLMSHFYYVCYTTTQIIRLIYWFQFPLKLNYLHYFVYHMN